MVFFLTWSQLVAWQTPNTWCVLFENRRPARRACWLTLKDGTGLKTFGHRRNREQAVGFFCLSDAFTRANVLRKRKYRKLSRTLNCVASLQSFPMSWRFLYLLQLHPAPKEVNDTEIAIWLRWRNLWWTKQYRRNYKRLISRSLSAK